MAVYRDTERPTFVAEEFAALVDGVRALTDHLPNLKKYLLEYPKVTLPKAESFLYWQNAKFGLKPTIRINHLTIADQQTHVAVVWRVLVHKPLLLDGHRTASPGARSGARRGILVRQRKSQPIGWTGRFHGLAESEARCETEQKGMQAALRITKTRMER